MDEHRHTHRFLVHGDLVSQAVIAEVVAVVRQEDDDRVLIESGGFHLLHERADLFIEHGHIAVVGFDDLLHGLRRARRAAGLTGRCIGIDRELAIAEADLARGRLIEETLHRWRLHPVRIERDDAVLVDVFEPLRGGVRHMRVMRREPEQERAPCIRLPLQELVCFLERLFVIGVLDLSTFSKTKRRRLTQMRLPIQRSVITRLPQHHRQGHEALLLDHALLESR